MPLQSSSKLIEEEGHVQARLRFLLHKDSHCVLFSHTLSIRKDLASASTSRYWRCRVRLDLMMQSR